MKDFEFYRKYANEPLLKRNILIEGIDGEPTTLNLIYKEIHAIDDKIRTDVIRKNKLLQSADRYYYKDEN